MIRKYVCRSYFHDFVKTKKSKDPYDDEIGFGNGNVSTTNDFSINVCTCVCYTYINTTNDNVNDNDNYDDITIDENPIPVDDFISQRIIYLSNNTRVRLKIVFIVDRICYPYLSNGFIPTYTLLLLFYDLKI